MLAGFLDDDDDCEPPTPNMLKIDAVVDGGVVVWDKDDEDDDDDDDVDEAGVDQ